MLDSESWQCRDCGGQMIGGRTPDDLCGPCIARRLGEPAERTEPVPAGELAAGDIVRLDDGTVAEVTDVRRGDFWLNTGRHGPGVAIGWRSGSSSGVMFRRGADLLQRAGGAR